MASSFRINELIKSLMYTRKNMATVRHLVSAVAELLSSFTNVRSNSNDSILANWRLSKTPGIYTERLLTLSPPIPLRLYTLPYWSNPPF